MDYLQAVAGELLQMLIAISMVLAFLAPLLVGAIVTEVTGSNRRGFKIAGYLAIAQVIFILLLSPLIS